MKLAELLEMDAEIPEDDFEAYLWAQARAAKLMSRTVEVMREFYPDYEEFLLDLEALWAQARAAKLMSRTVEVMREFYPDYEECTERLLDLEARLSRRFGKAGDA